MIKDHGGQTRGLPNSPICPCLAAFTHLTEYNEDILPKARLSWLDIRGWKAQQLRHARDSRPSTAWIDSFNAEPTLSPLHDRRADHPRAYNRDPRRRGEKPKRICKALASRTPRFSAGSGIFHL